MIEIGPYKLPNRVALAPMAGVTDLAFRRLCRELGAGLVVSEMISCNPKLRDTNTTLLRSRHHCPQTPVLVFTKYAWERTGTHHRLSPNV